MPGIDKNTLLMLHGNEFVDVSPIKKKITNQGATISEETHFQGQKSFYFDGSTKVVQVEPPAYDFGAGDFTIDWWENCTTGVRFSTNYSLEEGGILLGYDGKALYIGEPGKWEIFYNQTAFNVTPGQWVHWAFVRNGSTFTSYRNGKRFWSGTSDKRIYFDATDIWSIGNYRPDGISAFKGYIQEFRVSNIARWTSDFEPPTEPYSPENAIEVTLPRENGRTTYCRQFTYNPKGEYNSRRDGAIVSGMPVAGNPVTDLPTGTLFRVNIENQPWNFVKVHGGNPDSGIYDASCDGQWLRLEHAYTKMQWNSADTNDYANCLIGEWVRNTFPTLLDEGFRSLIKTVKVPYRVGASGSAIGQLECKAFDLGGWEIGYGGLTSDFTQYLPKDGAKLDFYQDGDSAEANAKRVTSYQGSPGLLGLRSALINGPQNWYVWNVNTRGAPYLWYKATSQYITAPCVIIPNDALVSPEPNGDGSYNLIY